MHAMVLKKLGRLPLNGPNSPINNLGQARFE